MWYEFSIEKLQLHDLIVLIHLLFVQLIGPKLKRGVYFVMYQPLPEHECMDKGSMLLVIKYFLISFVNVRQCKILEPSFAEHIGLQVAMQQYRRNTAILLEIAQCANKYLLEVIFLMRQFFRVTFQFPAQHSSVIATFFLQQVVELHVSFSSGLQAGVYLEISFLPGRQGLYQF